MPVVSAQAGLSAHQPRGRVRPSRNRTRPASRSSIPTCRTTGARGWTCMAHLHRRPRLGARARGGRGAAGQRQGPRERARRSASWRRRAHSGRSSPPPSPCASSASRSPASRRSSVTCERGSTPGSCRRTTCSLSRRACRSSARCCIDAQNQRDSARAELARLIGAPRGCRLRAGGRAGGSRSAGARHGQIIDRAAQARGARADRQALAVPRARRANARIDAARSGNRPSIAIVAGYDYARPNPVIFPRAGRSGTRRGTSGVNVSWTLWNGGRTARRGRRSAAARPRPRASGSPSSTRRSRSRSASGSSTSTSARAQVADRAARPWPARSKPGASSQERFAAGVATTTDLLDAQQDQLEAELQRTRALANVKLAEARLARALGN